MTDYYEKFMRLTGLDIAQDDYVTMSMHLADRYGTDTNSADVFRHLCNWWKEAPSLHELSDASLVASYSSPRAWVTLLWRSAQKPDCDDCGALLVPHTGMVCPDCGEVHRTTVEAERLEAVVENICEEFDFNPDEKSRVRSALYGVDETDMATDEDDE
jgi:predicted RNA-binding Zn-ribbon protein involved in translation (DUF1610 family)